MARGESGAIAQLGERLLCKQEVAGSIPAGSTNLFVPPRLTARSHTYIACGVCVASCEFLESSTVL
jgi:hypothetical protein